MAGITGFTGLAVVIGASAASAADAPRAASVSAIQDFSSYCAGGVALWGKSLCGPLLLVDPATRSAVASSKPQVGDFVPQGSVWSGTLPKEVAVANTAVRLGGEHFAEILLPLPDDPIERRILLSHESFHRIQPDLGFKGEEADNGHLDAKDGRIFARLEMAALKAALNSRDWRSAARDALAYRAARLALFANAEAAEASLLANEGVAEYTGIRVGAGAGAKTYAVKRLENGAALPSLIRSFGYVVGPAYGLLLDRTAKSWRASALKGRPLPELLTEAMSIPQTGQAIQSRYGGQAIAAEETARDERIQQRRRELMAALVDGPTVTFPFEKMAIEFNPNSLFSLGEGGTVYSQSTSIRDAWGALKASGVVLISPDWNFARVPGPATLNGRSISGSTWTADLTQGYAAVPGTRPGDFIIKKQ